MVMRGRGNANFWQTPVECALAKTDRRNETQVAWLSHECRAEDISHSIFEGQRIYEAVAVKGWDQTIFLRSGSYNYSLNPARPDQLTYERGALEIQINCEPRTARNIDFAETLALFQNGGGNKIYMLIEYEKDSCRYRLYAPCRCVNYPAPDSGERYLQPISGYVLFDDAAKISVGYVAAHVREDETSVEYCLREKISYINTKQKRSRLYRLFSLFDFLILRFFFVTDEFTRVEKLPSARCTFFVYEH